MAPPYASDNKVLKLDKNYVDELEQDNTYTRNEKSTRPLQIVWRNVILFVLLHIGAAIGLYQAFTVAKWATLAWTIALYFASALGITMGAHRLWAHRSFKAAYPLKVILVIFQSIAFQNSVIEWSRDHRGHHKWSDTDADPHNAQRGFFFTHMGWLLCKKHPDVIAKGKSLDMSDLTSDPLLVWQDKNYKACLAFFCFFVPTVVPIIFWDESPIVAFYIPALLRYCLVLHATWCINSVAHYFGNKPYDRFIRPAQNEFTAIFALGEGWHNYHHAFPYDYKAAELPYHINPTTMLIDLCAKIGWAYEMKTASDEIIQAKKERSGDQSKVE